jgi:hypothetical protein
MLAALHLFSNRFGPLGIDEPHMNWKLIILLSLFGLAMGFATVFFIPANIEPIFWLVIFIICAYLIARYAPGGYFLHGLLVSIINSLWITATHAALFYTYIANHPEYLMMSDQLPRIMAGHPRRMMVLTGPIVGVISGLILGFLAWAASKIVKNNK